MIIALQTLIFFRESIFAAIDRFIRPYFKRLALQFKDEDVSDDDSDDHVFADYDDERGVVFYPPVYLQRYAAVTDCLMDERWYGKLKKVVDFGYNDMSFIKYLKDVPGVVHVLGVDLETIPIRCSYDLIKCKEFIPKKETPLEVTLFQGNAADPDYRLIGTDAVVAIEMIEHMLPHDLERFIHTVFGFIKPRVAVFTTPNGDFNVLFKALETNGLRRLDHFFEWSREQFNDWCSNIVLRYPQYTVTCKGIGPGPAGTLHLGCCSQLAFFVAKEYQKQPDLNLNSLALLAKQPSPASLLDGWESPDTIGDNNMLCIENSVESYTELVLKQQSFMTIILTSPSFSLATMEYKDKMSQCNLDFEFGKNFLMFDDEMYYNILIPRRNRVNRVYMIEDVANRLNCSTLQVKKFSKATKNLLENNQMDPYTKEVLDEIRYLTKTLNFNKDTKNKKLQNGHIWYNINWGENAPYWNEYYRTVREYSYPCQVKSEDSRIMDAISEEINGIADKECDKSSVETQTLEIPINRLMEVVDHITVNVDRVKELLEWNGYDIVGDNVMYSPLALDHISDSPDEWQHTDTASDWDTTDTRSNTLPDSTIAPDLYGRYLHRVLDHKIRRIRSITDENITTELDRIVCRLMNLALHTSKRQESPPPMSWMQKKLIDLLSLTEKAIERRRRHYALKAIEYCKEDNIKEILNVTKETEDASEDIMAKYHHFISPPDLIESQDFRDDKILELEFDDSSSDTSKEIKDKQDENNVVVIQEFCNSNKSDNIEVNTLKSDFTPIVLSNDLIPNKDIENIKKLDVNTENMACNNQMNLNHCTKLPKKVTETNKWYITSQSYIQKTKNRSKQNMLRMKCKHSKHSKKISGKRSMKNIVKLKTTVSVESASRRKNKIIGHKKRQSILSKPIPDSLINLFKVDQNTDEIEEFQKITPNCEIINDTNNIPNNISTTENCLFISIITESGEESIPLRRNIGTDPETNCNIHVETISETVINITKDESFNCKHSVSAENLQSDTIFIYDINEPSTSKGIRNISTDVQCGPDNSLTCAQSPVLSLTRTPKLFFNGIKIEDSCHNIPVTKKTCDFGMSTECNSAVAVSKSIGIKIKKSNVGLRDENDFTIAKSPENVSSGKDLTMETKLLKRMSPKVDDSDSEFCGSVGSLQKSLVASSSKNSGSQIQCATNNSVPTPFLRKNPSRKLVCGGIYVYSLKDKMVSEDVVYQGEWQRAPKIIAKKQSSELTKRRKNIITKKKQIYRTDTQKANENKRFPQRSPAVSLKRNSNMNEELKNMDQKKKTPQRHQNTIRANKNITRVVSKINIRPHRSKSIKPFKKPTQYNIITKTENETCKRNIKNYLPLYLRRKIKILNNEKDNSKKLITAIDKNTKNIIFKTNPAEIAKDILKVPDNMYKNKNIDYVIFQNGVETEHNVVKNLTLPPSQVNTVIKTSCSPQSQNSSTCSSPNSVATVRAIKMERHRIISNQKDTLSKESHSGLKSENNFSKYKHSKYSRVNIKSPLVCSNKENIPQSSKNMISNVGKIILKSNKSVTIKSKSLFMAHTNESTRQTSKKITKKTPFKSPKPLNLKNNNEEEQKIIDLTNSNILLPNQNSNNLVNESFNASISDVNDSVDEMKSYDNISLNNNSEINDESYKMGSDLSKTPKQSVHETASSIMSVIRKLLEDKLKVTDSNSKNSLISNFETVILNIDEPNKSFSRSVSPISTKTVVTNEDISISESEVVSSFAVPVTANKKESLLSFPSEESKEIDSVSFMSVASTSNSKFSEYYLADNELDNTLLPQSDHPLEESSVQDIFERKDQNKHVNVNGILEAFSGFSVNAEPSVGDNINLIDSETGSIALNSARRTVSEELFVSGRSSDTYESCYFDDDNYVPSWLFSVMSQQQSIEESETVDEPPEEAMFDVNGNVMEPGVRMTSGAGDGKGIHSDNSQDSSGRGTSLSSTASESGPENEAMLVDLSAATAYQPLIITAINITEELNSTHTNEVPSGNDGSECARNLLNRTQIASDVDADVSSLDTDAIDSDT